MRLEVGAERQHDAEPIRVRRQGPVEEPQELLALAGIPAEGDQLLELVDDQQQPAGRLVGGPGANPSSQGLGVSPEFGQSRTQLVGVLAG